MDFFRPTHPLNLENSRFFFVCVSKSLRKWTQTDTNVTFLFFCLFSFLTSQRMEYLQALIVNRYFQFFFLVSFIFSVFFPFLFFLIVFFYLRGGFKKSVEFSILFKTHPPQMQSLEKNMVYKLFLSKNEHLMKI